MSIFQDARSKWKARYRGDEKLEPNPYYEKMLDGMGEGEFLRGFDYAIDEVKSFILNNLQTEEENINEEMEIINLLAILDKYSQRIADAIGHYMESRRDELVTGLIEGMSEEEYDSKFKQIWGCTQEEAQEKEWKDEDI